MKSPFLTLLTVLLVSTGQASHPPMIEPILSAAATASCQAEQFRQLMIRDWIFETPVSLSQKAHEGPDFTVTYLSADDKKMSMGIYEGCCPQNLAKERSDVRHEQEKIGGQMTTWALWEDVQNGVKSFHAEVFIMISPESKNSDRFHLFASAMSSADLDFLRAIARSAHHK